jgi:hypothetical protein
VSTRFLVGQRPGLKSYNYSVPANRNRHMCVFSNVPGQHRNLAHGSALAQIRTKPARWLLNGFQSSRRTLELVCLTVEPARWARWHAPVALHEVGEFSCELTTKPRRKARLGMVPAARIRYERTFSQYIMTIVHCVRTYSVRSIAIPRSHGWPGTNIRRPTRRHSPVRRQTMPE